MVGLLQNVCEGNGYHPLEYEVEPVFLRALLSLRPEHTPSEVAQRIKGVLSRRLKQEHPDAFPTVTDGKVWGDGYFCRSVGKARKDVVEGYITEQAEHHGYTAETLRQMRYRFETPAPTQPIDICYHIVWETQHHAPLFSPEVTDRLVEVLREEASKDGGALRRATFLPDHVHLSARTLAKTSPKALAERLMTAGWEWMTEHYEGSLKFENAWNVWELSAYVGTMGEVTTDHVRNSLRAVV